MKREYFKNARLNTQLSVEQLIEQTINLKQGSVSSTGALCINTGKFTGRSPKDRFIVKDLTTEGTVDWNSEFNHGISAERFSVLKKDVLTYLDGKKELWFRRCYACAHADYRIGINVFNEYPSGNLFAYNMFLRPEEIASDLVLNDWVMIQAPDFKADPAMHGTRSANFAIISFTERTILIGGTGYTGEMKKAVFSALNYLLPSSHNVLSMHCSANVGDRNDVALFFGLSGTGKTTLSTDIKRKLIGDDEHGWDKDSVFNFEGGCYAKVIGLHKDEEPEIFSAIKKGALVENVVFHKTKNIIDFEDSSITENTRVSYPIDFIENRITPSLAGTPSTIFFLTCDASGVFPPVSKLSVAQAKYYFLNGYTSKIAGTETGITEPKATFSTCFGAPFLPLQPISYAEMLGEKLQENEINVWLINTGWSGLPYSKGKRISLKHTRSIISAALSGKLEKEDFERFPVFNLMIPKKCPGVPDSMLNPLKIVESKDDFLTEMNSLAERFNSNFEKFKDQVKIDILLSSPQNQW